jgi:hypothetical protein
MISACQSHGSFVPTDISGCTLWVRPDANRLTLVSSTHVSVVTPIIAGGSSIAQGTDANRPDYVASAVNGQPGIQASATKWLTVSSMSAPTATTMFFALSPSSLSQTYHISGNSGGFGIIHRFSGSSLEWFNGSGTDRLTFVSTWTSGAGIATATQTNGSALTLYWNGTQAATKATAGANLVAFEELCNYSALSHGSDGYLLEVLVFNSVLSSTNRSRVHRYLGTRYNITVA